MPQASEKLRKIFKDDYEAVIVLETNFNDNKGLITKKDPNYTPTQHEWDAIEYLVHEWDYAYDFRKGVDHGT